MLSPPTSASLSFSLRPPLPCLNFPAHDDTTTNPANAAFPLPPSCVRGPFSGRAREPLLILLTPAIEPTCPLALADSLSTGAPTKPGDTSHTTAGALHPVEEASTAWRPCRPVPLTTRIRCHEDWRIFFRKAGILVQLNRHRRPMREVPHQRGLVTFGGLGQTMPFEGPNDVQSPPWASILPCRDLKRVEMRSSWRHS